MASSEASDPARFPTPDLFFFSPCLSPFPHPSIYQPSTHRSPLSPLWPCRAGPAFHLLSVPARSSPGPPPPPLPSTCIYNSIKNTNPFFLLPLIFLHSPSPFFFFQLCLDEHSRKSLHPMRGCSRDTHLLGSTDDANTH